MRPKQVAGAAAAIAFVCLPVLWKRHRAEQDNSTVEICLELPEVRILCRSQGRAVPEFLSRARAAGVTSLALYERVASALDPADTSLDSLRRFERAARREGGFPAEDIEEIRRNGLGFILRASDGTMEHLTRLLAPFANPQRGPVLSALGEETLGYPDNAPSMAELIRRGHFHLAMVEFAPQKGLDELARKVPESVIRTHSIDAMELRKLGPEESKARWLRAVRERSVRLLYMHLLPEETAAENLEKIRSLTGGLRAMGFQTGLSTGVTAPVHGTLWRQAAGGVAAITFPLAGLWAAIRGRGLSPGGRFLLMSAITGSGGLLIGALGYCLPLMNGIELFRGVKLELTLPICLAPCVLLSRQEMGDSLRKPVLFWEALAAAAAAGVIGILIIRSGNAGAEFMPGLEGHLRETLQKIFFVRPRFKEFLIGHPLMVAGLMRYQSHSSRRERWPLWLITAGVVGQTSLLNTFSHFHIPIEISLLRAGLGLALGYVLGRLIAAGLARSGPSPA
jgi:hypothetical protein